VVRYRAGVAVVDGKLEFLEQGILTPQQRLGDEAETTPVKRETAVAS